MRSSHRDSLPLCRRAAAQGGGVKWLEANAGGAAAMPAEPAARTPPHRGRGQRQRQLSADASASVADELLALKDENHRLLCQLSLSNGENEAIWEQVSLCRDLLLRHNVAGAEKIGADGGPGSHFSRQSRNPTSANTPTATSRRTTVDSLAAANSRRPSSTPQTLDLLTAPTRPATPTLLPRTSFSLKAAASALANESLSATPRARSSSGPPGISAEVAGPTRRASVTTLPKPASSQPSNESMRGPWTAPHAEHVPGSPYAPELPSDAPAVDPSWKLQRPRHSSIGERILWWVRQPIPFTSTFRQLWDVFMLVCLTYVIIVVPYRVAFQIDDHTADVFWAVEWAMQGAFLLDIFINLRTTYMRNGRLVTDARAIAKHYCKSWLLCDLIAVIPVSVAADVLKLGTRTTGLGHIPVLFKMLKLNKLLKLLRLLRLSILMDKVEAVVPGRFIRVFKFFVVVIIISHVTACLFYFSAVVNDLDEHTWPSKVKVLGQSNWHKYWMSMYWAVSTLCKVGYGDVVGTTVLEQLYSIAAMLIGATVFAYFMGNMAVLVANLDQEQLSQERKQEAINTFLLNHQFPKELRKRVKDYYLYLWRHQMGAVEDDLLQALNGSLRTDVVLYMYRGMVEKVPFFQGKHPQFISALVLCLRPEIYGPGDFVVREGDIGHDMYFLVEGTVHVLSSKEGTILRTFRSGEFFGEMALITGQRRSASCAAEGYCEVYSLSKENLELILKDWPDIAQDFYSGGLKDLKEAYESQQVEPMTASSLDTPADALENVAGRNEFPLPNAPLP